MGYREKLDWIGFAVCVAGAAHAIALLVLKRAWLDSPEILFVLVGLIGLGYAALYLALCRSEADDEWDVLIRAKSLGLAAQVMVFGLMAAMILSKGGTLGVVPDAAIWLLIMTACATASGRSLYLYRHSV